MKIFKKRYEWAIMSAHENNIESNMNRWVSNGWEVYGNPCVHYHGSPTNASFIYFPMRRKL